MVGEFIQGDRRPVPRKTGLPDRRDGTLVGQQHSFLQEQRPGS